jgi:hypothetical protein
MAESVAELTQRLVGAWELSEWSEIQSDGKKSFPLGEDAVGQIVYSADGHVAAQLVRAVRQKFQSDDWRDASEKEGATAFKEYFGYFGTFSIDLAHQAVVHHVRGAWFPNIEGGDQRRSFQFDNARLVLDADTPWGKVRIIWRRPEPSDDESIQVDYA